MKILDLTQKMSEGMPVYPGDPLFQNRLAADHETDGFRVTHLSFGSHTGTHVDVPSHFFADGETLDQFSLQTFQTLSIVIDLRDRLESFRFGNLPPLILPELLEPFQPLFQKAESVILKTGWSEMFGSAGYYKEFPSLLPETADWIAEQPIRILGLETPSLSSLANFEPDDGSIPQSKRRSSDADISFFLHSDAEAHRILLGRTPPLLLLENLFCPEELQTVNFTDLSGSWEEKFFTLLCFPLPIEGGDASPVRAAAILDLKDVKS